MKKNCWEHKSCGREPGGVKVKELGACPAATDTRLNGIHSGMNTGRACWVITGTYCKGEVQGVFARKFGDCMNCDFYKMVQTEEYPKFMLSVSLLKILSEK
jgi:hypothetical protein